MKGLSQSQLEDEICYHKYLYYELAAPILSDYDYDKLESELKKRFPDSKVNDYIECPRELWNKYKERRDNL